MKQISFLIVSFLLITSCGTKKQTTNSFSDKTETTMDQMDFNAFLEITPFNYVQFKLKKNAGEDYLIVQNGTEELKVSNYQLDKERLTFIMPVFESKIEAKFTDGNLYGTYYKLPGQEKGQVMNFTAFNNKKLTVLPPQFTDYEIEKKNLNQPAQNMNGKWSVTFSPDMADDEYPAIGEFQQKGNDLEGTFITETGDYRFLAGKIYGEDFYLSCFDGSHAFLFKGTIKNDDLKGTFWSGTAWQEPFIGKRNANANLNDPYKLTYIKEGADPFDFSFSNLKGETVSLKDDQFKDKAVVVQIFGTWCPNCMDETALYAELSKTYKEKGVEFVGVAFERGETLEKALPLLEKYQKHFDLDYTLLFGGKASKKLASEKFPMLNKIISFPTTIVLNRKHEVVKIHTGFYGPATSAYTEYEKGFRQLLDEI